MTPAGVVGRVGGLAAVLGAGVVVGLAAAAPASADDSGAADTGSRPSAAQHSARSHTADRSGPSAVARRGSAAAAAATGVAARPAATVSASRVVRSTASIEVPVVKAAAPQDVPTAPRPSAVSPAPVSAPVAAPVAPSASAVAPAPAPAAAANSLGSLLCDPRGKRITVLKGVHFVIPQSPAFFVKKVSGTGTFTADSVYDLKDVDQYDWNKFTGIAFSPIQHDRNSVMVGWRYNLTTQEFEIAPFYNVNKERILPNEQTEVISVPADGTFTYTVDYSGVTISYGDKTVFKPYPTGLTPNIWTATRVSGWFGGNEVAPRTLTYYLKL